MNEPHENIKIILSAVYCMIMPEKKNIFSKLNWKDVKSILANFIDFKEKI